MVATRQLVPPVAGAERALWLSNALQSLSPEERAETLASRRKQIQPRNLKKKIPCAALKTRTGVNNLRSRIT